MEGGSLSSSMASGLPEAVFSSGAAFSSSLPERKLASRRGLGFSSSTSMGSKAAPLLDMRPMDPNEAAEFGYEAAVDVIDTVDEQEGGKSSVIQVTYNFINVVVGAGIVGLPWVFVQGGFWLALFEMLLCCALTDYSVRMLITTGIENGQQNYEDLCFLAFGNAGHFIVSLTMTIFDYGAMLSYIIIMGDAASFALEQISGWSADSWAQRRTCIVVLTTLLILPSCLLRDISSLSKLSAVSVFTVVVIIFIVIIKFATLESHDLPLHPTTESAWVAEPLSGTALDNCAWVNPSVPKDYQASATHLPSEYFVGSTDGLGGPGIFMAFSIIAFSFVCHDSAFLIFQTLRANTAPRWARVTHLSMGGALLVCLLLAIPGFLTFGYHTCPNLLNNYDKADKLIIFMRLVYILTMAFTFPLSFFVVRHVINVWVFESCLGDYQTTQKMSLRRHLALTLPLLGSCVLVCCFVKNLGVIMSLAGSLGAVTLAFVLPPLCRIKLSPYSLYVWRNEGHVLESAVDLWGACALILFGLVAVVGSVYNVATGK